MQRPTQQYIETCKQYPISTATALLVARDRREALNTDIENYLTNGGKITVIERPQVGRKPIEQVMNFNGDTKTRRTWQSREKYLDLMNKHQLSLMLLAGRLRINRQTLMDYLNGKISPAPHTTTNIQVEIEFMVKEKVAQKAEAKELLKCCF
jgi:hypothetical protein